MLDKSYEELETTEYVFSLGVIYATCTIAVNAGFFVRTGFDYAYLFSATDLLIANIFVVRNVIFILFIVTSVLFVHWVLSTSFARYRAAIDAVTAFVGENIGWLNGQVGLTLLMMGEAALITGTAAAFIPRRYFLPQMILSCGWYVPSVYFAWSAFRTGTRTFGLSLLMMGIWCSLFFYVFGERWADSLIASPVANTNLTTANSGCLPMTLLRGSSNGVLVWSTQGSYLLFVPWSQVVQLSGVPCQNSAASPSASG